MGPCARLGARQTERASLLQQRARRFDDRNRYSHNVFVRYLPVVGSFGRALFGSRPTATSMPVWAALQNKRPGWVMNAAQLAHVLGGRKSGSVWMTRCPAHNDRTPSLSIRDADDNKMLVRCHAGCAQERVITALRTRGLWTNNSPCSYPTQRSNVQYKPDKDDAKRTEVAFTIWKDVRQAIQWSNPISRREACISCHRRRSASVASSKVTAAPQTDQATGGDLPWR